MGDSSNSNVKIDITANADGVKPGVAATEKELNKLEQSTSTLDKKYTEAAASSEKLSGATARTTQQFVTLGKEIATGETGRIPGTLARIAVGFGPIGIAVGGVTAAIAAGVWAWNEWGSSADDAVNKAMDRLQKAEEEARKAKHKSAQEEIQDTKLRIESLKGSVASIEWERSVNNKKLEDGRISRAEWQKEEEALAKLRGARNENIRNEEDNLNRKEEALAKNTKESKKLTDAERERKRLQEKEDREAEKLNLQADAMGELAARWNHLNNMVKDGSLSAEAMAYELEHAGKKGKAAAEESSKAWETFADNTQRTLSDVFYDGMNGKFNSVEEAFKQMLFRMAANAAAARLTEAMFGKKGKDGSSDSGWIGAIINAFTNHEGGVAGLEATSSKQVNPAVFSGAPRFHTGGITGDEIPIIAKRGEGVFTPEQMKRLAPTGGNGGGAPVINDNSVYHIDSRSDRASLLADFNRLSDAKFARWTDQMRRQGAIA